MILNREIGEGRERRVQIIPLGEKELEIKDTEEDEESEE